MTHEPVNFFGDRAVVRLWQHDYGVRLAIAGDYITAGMPVTVQYQLATPIITDLNLGQLKTFPRFTRLDQDGAIKATITARARVAG